MAPGHATQAVIPADSGCCPGQVAGFFCWNYSAWVVLPDAWYALFFCIITVSSSIGNGFFRIFLPLMLSETVWSDIFSKKN